MITMSDQFSQELKSLRHSAAHLLAAAVKDLWPGTHNAIGPAIEDGFYQDFDFGDRTISEKDFPKIEKRMMRLVKSWGPFQERSISIEKARELFADNPYKLELAEEFAREGKSITVNDPGNFLDLCKGGHFDEVKEKLKHFKLLSLAGAYWLGDEKNKMLTRIYGTAFFSKEELAAHLTMLEETKKRDHRKLGKQLDLFIFSDLVGPGLPLFTPRGTTIRRELESYVRSLQNPRGR
jgi:threonyl-tRNA synthetase